MQSKVPETWMMSHVYLTVRGPRNSVEFVLNPRVIYLSDEKVKGFFKLLDFEWLGDLAPLLQRLHLGCKMMSMIGLQRMVKSFKTDCKLKWPRTANDRQKAKYWRALLGVRSQYWKEQRRKSLKTDWKILTQLAKWWTTQESFNTFWNKTCSFLSMRFTWSNMTKRGRNVSLEEKRMWFGDYSPLLSNIINIWQEWNWF